MNQRPNRDEFEDLITKLNEPEYGEDGPDILAVRRREPQPSAGQAPAQPPQAPPPRPARGVARQQADSRRGAPAGKPPKKNKDGFVLNIEDEEYHSIPDSHGGNGGGQRPPRRPSGGGRKPPDSDSGDGQPPRQGGSRVNRWLRAFLFSFIIVGCAVFLAFFAIESANDLLGLNQVDAKIEVTITEDMSTGQIVDQLASAGVIDKKFTFRVYALIKDAAPYFKPGQYVMNSNLSYDEIFNMLWGGEDEEAPAVVDINFYEGMTAWEIANRLEEKKVCGAQDFINTLNTFDFSTYELTEDLTFFDRIPADNEGEKRFVRLEGFLFPDTYQFYVDDKPERVAARFFANFEQKIMANDQYDFETMLRQQGMTLYDAINFASVVQGEAGEVTEMRKVSAVFHNRFNNFSTYPKMESDVTRDYVKSDINVYADEMGITDNTVLEELGVAYDTYQSEGLPPGPVGNPGLEAIIATLEPDGETGEFFFFTDAEGQFHYSMTLDEHNQKIRQYGVAGS